MMVRDMRAAGMLFVAMAAITGVIYPLAMLGVGDIAFPHQVHGSLVRYRGRVVGSVLIGQRFRGPRWFWGRPSATAPMPYNAAASTASNLGPTNPVLRAHVQARIEALKAANPRAHGPVPEDLVTSSGSGLDPDISIAAARYQVPRVAEATGFARGRLERWIARATVSPAAGFMGEPVVNVLKLNLAIARARLAQRARGG